MEYDTELVQGSCLYNTLEGYLSRCKHGLHDDSLIEHYETIYQNNFLYYNKILALLRRTLDTSKANVERINAVIDNDVDLKDGIEVELERLHAKSDHVSQQIKLLEKQTNEIRGAFEEYAEQDSALEQSLNSVTNATKSTEERMVLSYYALANVKAGVTRIQGRTNAALLGIAKIERCIGIQQNVYQLVVGDFEDQMHNYHKEVERLDQIKLELSNEKSIADKEHADLIQRKDQVKARIGNLEENRQMTESALATLEGEIRQLEASISKMKDKLSDLQSEVSTTVDRLTTTTETKQRMKGKESALSGEITQLARETEAIEGANLTTKTTIEEQKAHLKQCEEEYKLRKAELDRSKSIRSTNIAACNLLRIQIDEMVTLFDMKALPRLNVARELIFQRAEAEHGALGLHDLQQLNLMLQEEKLNLVASEKGLSRQIESATLELHKLISQHDVLTTELEATQKRINSLNGEVARLRDELDQVTSKEDGRVQMKVDLINERDYINKSIEELKINNRDRKAMYTNQIRDQIEAHKLRLKLLKSDDSSDLVEIIDEETKNSNILLNAALESLEVANAGDKSKVEAKYNAMMLEETEKFEAIRKVNASEILRLRELVKNRRSRVKDAATAPETMVAKLPEEATMVTQPNDVNVHFKTPTTSNSTPSNSHDRVVSPQSTVKKEVRRKCIRRSSIKAEGTKGNGEDELDLFC